MTRLVIKIGLLIDRVIARFDNDKLELVVRRRMWMHRWFPYRTAEVRGFVEETAEMILGPWQWNRPLKWRGKQRRLAPISVDAAELRRMTRKERAKARAVVEASEQKGGCMRFTFCNLIYEVPEGVGISIEVETVSHPDGLLVVDYNFVKDGEHIPKLGGIDDDGNPVESWADLGIRKIEGTEALYERLKSQARRERGSGQVWHEADIDGHHLYMADTSFGDGAIFRCDQNAWQIAYNDAPITVGATAAALAEALALAERAEWHSRFDDLQP